MTFQFHHGLIWVALKLIYEEQPVVIENCILDTGSAGSAIDIHLIPFNYRKPSRLRQLVGIGGGKQEVITQKVESIEFADHIISDIEIEFGNLNIDLGINGFIGTDILSKFSVNINFSKQELTLSEEAPLLKPF